MKVSLLLFLSVLLATSAGVRIAPAQERQPDPKPNRDNLRQAQRNRPGQPGRQRGRQQRQQPMSLDRLKQLIPDNVTLVPDIAYRDGNKAWKLDLVMPKAAAAKDDPLRPGIVFVHGGGWRGGDKRGGAFINGAVEYAARGYVCVSVNYRLTGEAPFPACIEDVKCAVRWLRAHADEYHLDPGRIGAYGNSAGAHLVSMLGLVKKGAGLEGDGPWQDQSSLVQAVCAAATPTDLVNWKNNQPMGSAGRDPTGLLAGPADTLIKRARKASPITYVAADAPPFLLVHGTADGTVPVAQADRFVEALKKAGAEDVTYLRYENAGHGMFGQHLKETAPARDKFFERTLSPKNS